MHKDEKKNLVKVKSGKGRRLVILHAITVDIADFTKSERKVRFGQFFFF